MLGWIFAALLALFAGAGWFAAYRFYRKAVIYDEIFIYLQDDIQTNVRQFAKIATSNMTANEPEIQAAHRAMVIMGKRLVEIRNRMEEATGFNLKPPERPEPPRFA
jgi:hypothetical protein